MLKILICCAGGMSSGFLAANMKKYARKAGLELQVDAVSESSAGQMVAGYDALLIGPHYAAHYSRFKKIGDSCHVPVGVISHETYGMLDGEGAVKEAQKLISPEDGE
jgi:PTS system cellobiose-specific IIB component